MASVLAPVSTSVSLQPSANTATGVPVSQLLLLKPGDVINALVLSLVKDTTFRLQLPTGTLEVQADKPLVPGTRVEISVKGTAAEPEIFLTPLPDGTKSSRGGSLLSAQISTPTTTTTTATTDAAARSRPEQGQSERIEQVAATIVREAATRQGGIAQLYADLEASIAQPKSPVPAPVNDAAKQLFALRLDATGQVAVDADDIKLAIAQSGLANPTLSADALRSGVPLDARAVLLSLREALKNWESAERASLPMPAASSNAATPAPAAARQAGPMLPYPNGPTVPQPPADPALPANATPRELALHLLDKTDSAIAREMILKIVSLPERTDAAGRPLDTNASRMTFDIPMATQNGTAVAQLRVERDGTKRNGERIEPVWRANFSLDVEPIGAVHVRIALVGGKATVSLNAERANSAESLRAGLPLLEASLRDVELEPGALTCQAGQPLTASAEQGLYVDHAT